jgi:hypothetical protein
VSTLNHDLVKYCFVPVGTKNAIHIVIINAIICMQQKSKYQAIEVNIRVQNNYYACHYTHGMVAEKEESIHLPVSNSLWKGDACHTQSREDGKLI